MFDPFKDFDARGYLRNVVGEKNLNIVKQLEHDLFTANLADAMAYLSRKKKLTYHDFLKVHAILFGDLYPWAGSDRMTTSPDLAISKAGTCFCLPYEARRAVEEGLRLGQDKALLRQSPGLVMGFFAYGHPFLDGNGRTMLVVHSVLCHRAGFSISWSRTDKAAYLLALSEEIETPGKSILDAYLSDFIEPPLEPAVWEAAIHSVRGLNGLAATDTVEGCSDDPAISKKYEEFDQRRGYIID
ncbi:MULTISPECIES: Fic/DOC family protein [Pseudomonas]|uniref:protein adenylyltransferase n=1 Tax=Pseudomonas poae TaxID=200451 RepID=A0ABY0RY20_9PSED|nr:MULTISPECIES: Fic family protein [Pseudomonas]AGE27268.1 cell filamentation protein [Pseudomonas poae RE*1-1-14]KRP47143.1 cell filamentation protein Fic [Pseudomonas poae]MCF5776869.1 cell filamentation protein Fic [Pseudomonas poae]CRM13472.1 Adenosine monophosphate-protein transferase VbhT [Pseudomonas sp. 25 E 4]SDO61276.1 cell filamentation protein [Pseudomonas poae]